MPAARVPAAHGWVGPSKANPIAPGIAAAGTSHRHTLWLRSFHENDPYEIGVEEVALMDERIDAARNGPNLPPILGTQRGGSRHVAQRVVNRHSGESVRSGVERGREIATQIGTDWQSV